MAGGWFKTYPPGTPVRLVANVEENNRIRNILNDIRGIGCRIEKPAGLNGLGWRIIVGSGTDEDPIPDSDIGTDTGQVPYKPYDPRAAYGVPAGVIAMWSGTTAPQGWAICDGTNGTPDLRGRFIVGHKSGDTDFGVMGDTGGAKTHTHDNHSVSLDASHSHFTDPGLLQSASTVAPGADNIDALAYSSIPGTIVTTTNITLTQTLTHSSTKTLPPFYVLAYIQKL